MKSISLLVGTFLLVSCGKNTPGMGAVVGNTQNQAATTMQSPEPSVPLITELPPEDIYYGPQLQMHSDSLMDLLTVLGKEKTVVRKENIEQGIDRPYLEVGDIVIYPYLDTLYDGFLSKVIDVSGEEYLILHTGAGVISAQGIVSTGVGKYFDLLQNGQTVTYAEYKEPEEFISIE